MLAIKVALADPEAAPKVRLPVPKAVAEVETVNVPLEMVVPPV